MFQQDPLLCEAKERLYAVGRVVPTKTSLGSLPHGILGLIAAFAVRTVTSQFLFHEMRAKIFRLLFCFSSMYNVCILCSGQGIWGAGESM